MRAVFQAALPLVELYLQLIVMVIELTLLLRQFVLQLSNISFHPVSLLL